MADITNANVAPNLDVDKLENEHNTLISLGIDESGSMSGYTDVMRDNIRKMKESLLGSKEQDEMLVSITRFAGGIQSSGFQLVDDIENTYAPSGMTCLYDSILVMKQQLTQYMAQLKSNGVRCKGVVCIFSDGDDTASQSTIRQAADAVAEMQKEEIIVAFVAFGDDAKGIADQLGVSKDNVLEVSASESELRKCFDCISKSAISSSKAFGQGQSSNSFFV